MQLDELLPPKATVNITRLSNRSSVYSVASDGGAASGPPLFFEMDYGGIYPTVYSLWRVPDICAVRIATYSEVSPKVRTPVVSRRIGLQGRSSHAIHPLYERHKRMSSAQSVARGAARTLVIRHVQVLGGADLFLQGFSAPTAELSPWRANDTAVIVVPGNRYPLAVGIMECDIGQAKASGMKVRAQTHLALARKAASLLCARLYRVRALQNLLRDSLQ